MEPEDQLATWRNARLVTRRNPRARMLPRGADLGWTCVGGQGGDEEEVFVRRFE